MCLKGKLATSRRGVIPMSTHLQSYFARKYIALN